MATSASITAPASWAEFAQPADGLGAACQTAIAAGYGLADVDGILRTRHRPPYASETTALVMRDGRQFPGAVR